MGRGSIRLDDLQKKIKNHRDAKEITKGTKVANRNRTFVRLCVNFVYFVVHEFKIRDESPNLFQHLNNRVQSFYKING